VKRGLVSAAACAALALAATTCAEVTAPRIASVASLHVVAGAGVEDTVDALLYQALVVEARDASGHPVPGVSIVFGADSATHVTIGRLDDFPFRTFAVDTTDARGQAAVLVQLGPQAGVGHVVATDTTSDAQVMAAYAVRAGAAASVDARPADSALYVGHAYALRAVVRDRRGNLRPDTVSFAVPAGVSAVSLSGTTVRGEQIGRGYVVATSGALVDTAWVSVVPQGTIAAYGLGGVVVVNLDGSAYHLLYKQAPPEDQAELQPQWSPSGDQIAFASWSELWIVDTGGTARRIHGGAPAVDHSFPLQYSPDGSWIYFSQATDSTGTWRVHPDGTGIEKLPAVWPGAAGPSPSPSGDSVAYRLDAFIAILDLASGTTTQLPIYGNEPRWSPVGNWIAFRDRAGQLNLMRPDGSGRRLIGGEGIATNADFGWSPDGQWLVYSAGHYNINGLVVNDLFLMNASTGEVLPLGYSDGLLEPSWRR